MTAVDVIAGVECPCVCLYPLSLLAIFSSPKRKSIQSIVSVQIVPFLCLLCFLDLDGGQGEVFKVYVFFFQMWSVWTRLKMTPVERHCSSWLVFDPGVKQRSDVYHRLASKLPLITEAGIHCSNRQANGPSCQHRLMCSSLCALTVYLGDHGCHCRVRDLTPAPSKLSAINFRRCAPAKEPQSLGSDDWRGHLVLGRVVVMQKLCVYGPEWSWTAEKGTVSWCVWHTSRIVANWRILHTNVLLMRRPCQHHHQTKFSKKENKESKMFPPDVGKMSSM